MESQKIDIRSLKFNETGKITNTLFVTRIMGGYIYETILEYPDMASVSLAFVPEIVDQNITKDNFPTVEVQREPSK